MCGRIKVCARAVGIDIVSIKPNLIEATFNVRVSFASHLTPCCIEIFFQIINTCVGLVFSCRTCVVYSFDCRHLICVY